MTMLNRGAQQSLVHRWDINTLQWVVWDGSVTGSAGGDGAILDGVSSAIRATVLSLTNSKPITTAIVDGAGTQITSFGGGTQYTEDAASVADPIGTQLIARRRDALSTETTTDGDVTAVNATGKGELYVKHVDSVAITNATLDVALSTLLSLTDFDSKTGSLTEAAPATDTASSGLNGRLQRIAQRLTSLIALVPTALTGSGNFKVAIVEDTTTNKSVNVAQFGGTTVVTGVGPAVAGAPRVTVSGDNAETAGTINGAGQTFAVTLAGYAGAGFDIAAGTLAATLAYEYSYDNGTSWKTAIIVLAGVQNLSGSVVTNPNPTLDGHFIVGEHWTNVRVRCSAWTSGAAVINVHATKLTSPLAVGAISSGTIGSSVPFWVTNIGGTDGSLTRAVRVGNAVPATSDYGLGVRLTPDKAASAAAAFTDPACTIDVRPGGVFPASAASADTLTNPTVTQIGSAGLLFNGTSWDRSRNNVNTTTGDTGTKVATFSGATQTNFNARGAIVTIILGTVSGTTPTLAAQLQWSPDGGTTWLTYGPALANLTATSQTGAILAYPTGQQQSLQNAATAAGIATGATVSLAMNIALPRTWRINYTIAGTTPSFAITSVQVNYIL